MTDHSDDMRRGWCEWMPDKFDTGKDFQQFVYRLLDKMFVFTDRSRSCFYVRHGVSWIPGLDTSKTRWRCIVFPDEGVAP